MMMKMMLLTQRRLTCRMNNMIIIIIVPLLLVQLLSFTSSLFQHQQQSSFGFVECFHHHHIHYHSTNYHFSSKTTSSISTKMIMMAMDNDYNHPLRTIPTIRTSSTSNSRRWIDRRNHYPITIQKLQKQQQQNEIKLRTRFVTSLLSSSISSEVNVDSNKFSSSLTSSQTTNFNVNKNMNNKMSTTDKNDQYVFFDTAKINVKGGNGGNGCVSFRREKGEARGGPNGGKGGNGGNIYLIGDNTINTLSTFHSKIHYVADHGKNGLGKNKDGAIGNDIIIHVPIGTIIRDLYTQEYCNEVLYNNHLICIAAGGRGGRGNTAFMTSRYTAPKLCERGGPGTIRWLSLELKLIADIGLIGKPNVGKSTLLSIATSATPKIANYPFTTTIPHLGICNIFDNDNDYIHNNKRFILCDIPGLIEGASQGIGMGDAFLRHVQKCSILLHIIDINSIDPIHDYYTIQKELKQYDIIHPNVNLMKKIQVIVINKIDTLNIIDNNENLQHEHDNDNNKLNNIMQQLRIASNHTRILPISAITTYNVKQLMQRIYTLMKSLSPNTDSNNDNDDSIDNNNNNVPASNKYNNNNNNNNMMIQPVNKIIDLSKNGLDYDRYDYKIISDPSYPNQYKIVGQYIEYVAKMTHWEYPEAVERFGRQLVALGISDTLINDPYNANDGDLIMIDIYDFIFQPSMTNPYIPSELLLKEERDNRLGRRNSNNNNDDEKILSKSYSSTSNKKGSGSNNDIDNDEQLSWRPFRDGGYLDMDTKELLGYQQDDNEDEDDDWNDLLFVNDHDVDDPDDD